jgi:hypothetical protein
MKPGDPIESKVRRKKNTRKSLEWAFDAAADDEPATSFIKTCYS